MSGTKKKRNKAYNPEKSLRAIVNQFVQKVYCYDAKCFPEMQYNDVVFRAKMPDSVKECVMYKVADAVLPWSIMLLSFESDGKDQWVETWTYDNLEPESSNKLNKLLDGELERRINGRNPKHVITWAWFALPMKNADMEGMRDQIISLFTEAGAFDRELCDRMHEERDTREKLIKGLAA